MTITHPVLLAVCLWLALASWMLFCLSLLGDDPDKRSTWRNFMWLHLTALTAVVAWMIGKEGLL